MQHPKLEQPLIDKLVEFSNPIQVQGGLRSAATKVLDNYKLDLEGKPVRKPASTVGWSVATVLRSAISSVSTFLRSAASFMLNVSGLNNEEQGLELAMHVEPPLTHSFGEIEEA
jgi:hypothetical protein